jgi:osmoprotectant transport system substrate-binding protein
MRKVQAVLPANLTVLAKSSAEDNDAMVVTKDRAEVLASPSRTSPRSPVTSPSPLRRSSRPVPRASRAWRSTYGVTFGTFVPLTGQGIVQALKNGQVAGGEHLHDEPGHRRPDGFVVLEDTKKLFGSQNIVPLVAKDRAEELRPVLDAVSAALTTPVLVDLLRQTDIDKKSPKDVAAAFLAANGLG